jgi:Kef-type K+ transport system membrane component KefB
MLPFYGSDGMEIGAFFGIVIILWEYFSGNLKNSPKEENIPILITFLYCVYFVVPYLRNFIQFYVEDADDYLLGIMALSWIIGIEMNTGKSKKIEGKRNRYIVVGCIIIMIILWQSMKRI